MTDRPILFSASMIRALIDGRKTQTRRVVKPQPDPRRVSDVALVDGVWCWRNGHDGSLEGPVRLPYAPGDRLWVRETWTHSGDCVWTVMDARVRGSGGVEYRADGDAPFIDWFPSIHMPREFSRLTLIVTDVRVQRVQEISEEDATAEGIYSHDHPELGRLYSYDVAGHIGVGCRNSVTVKPAGWSDPKGAFGSLWEKIHGRASWDANPWVVALTFTVHRQNIDQMQREATP